MVHRSNYSNRLELTTTKPFHVTKIKRNIYIYTWHLKKMHSEIQESHATAMFMQPALTE